MGVSPGFGGLIRGQIYNPENGINYLPGNSAIVTFSDGELCEFT